MSQVVERPATQTRRSAGFRDSRKFRQEIHGVRGLAIAGVVLFHIFGDGRVSGGIDVFLAITGFLAIPALLRRAAAGGGRIDMVERLAGLFRRILVPLFPVLVFVGVGGSLLLPLGMQADLWVQERASALFYENWQLIATNQDYNAAGSSASPLQHLWSIAIQMQFHLVAPFVVMAVAVLVSHLVGSHADSSRAVARVLFLVLLIITAASFASAAQLQQGSQGANYFSTWSRTWEISLAGAAALIVPRLRLGSSLRAALSWTGLLMVASTGFLLDGALVFPGPLALWPIGGLILVLAAGQTHSKWGADRLWHLRPVVFLADISYSLYLWHWPIIIFWFHWTGQDHLSALSMVVVLSLSVLAGWAGHVVFEKRFAARPFFTGGRTAQARTVVAGVAAMALAAATFTFLEFRADVNVERSLALGAENAASSPAKKLVAVPAGPHAAPPDWAPALDIAWRDLPDVYSDQTQPIRECFQRHTGPVLTPRTCSNGVENPRKRILLAGGSHVDQWWGALAGLAAQHDVELLLMSRTSCNLWETTADQEHFDELIEADPAGATAKCIEWNRLALPAIVEMKPDLVVTLGTKVREGEDVAPQAAGAWATLDGAGIPLLLVRDNPYWGDGNDPNRCLQSARDPSECFLLRSDVYSSEFDGALPGAPSGTVYLDLAPYFCDDVKCPAAVGDLPLYRDYMHVTQSFAVALEHVFAAELEDMGIIPR